jgi:hypothetical protein
MSVTAGTSGSRTASGEKVPGAKMHRKRCSMSDFWELSMEKLGFFIDFWEMYGKIMETS